ncbi:hypothetical protein [Clostridium butyricum]
MIYTKINRKELQDILNVKNDGLKKIIRKGQLEKRLNDLGYQLISTEKEGRNTYYNISKEEKGKCKELLNNIIKYHFGTTHYEQFIKYLLYRFYNLGQPITKKLIADNIGVDKKTITRWDNKLLEHNFIGKDGYWYVRAEIKENNIIYVLTDEWEYNSYSNNMRYVAKDNMIVQRLEDEEFDRIDFELMLEALKDRKSITDDKYVYRVKKFFKKNDYELCTQLFKMILSTQKVRLYDYYMKLI